MTFNEALQKLGIEKYAERIFHSNSHGELFFLTQYIELAQMEDTSWFAAWFDDVVAQAEANWERPESVFQHPIQILQSHLKSIQNK